jgi:hypothetical protein
MERDRQAALDTRTEAQRWLDRGDPHCHNEFAALVREYFYPLLMSALLPKADMCSAARDVRFGPIADIAILIRSPRRRGRAGLVAL